MLDKTRSRSRIAKKSKTKTAEEKEHMAKVAALGCIICRSPANLHHPRHGMGLGQRASNFDVIPLCHRHHQGTDGIHTLGTKVWQEKYGQETELLDKVRKLLEASK